jgi:hypothetical protein
MNYIVAIYPRSLRYNMTVNPMSRSSCVHNRRVCDVLATLPRTLANVVGCLGSLKVFSRDSQKRSNIIEIVINHANRFGLRGTALRLWLGLLPFVLASQGREHNHYTSCVSSVAYEIRLETRWYDCQGCKKMFCHSTDNA